ncbi:hypothetical protein [Desulfoluna spongiiphila]|uniref:hypothetical protein n=1 Tax=Desulfoluna spongiiphila TaxID=419481 RepID=UPI001256F635|nr:hypothetical protein [Desulfoluna spongiiphila]VVS94771.1 hypothetical protein DBB_43430 [Desulfoluna spongiiphila]
MLPWICMGGAVVVSVVMAHELDQKFAPGRGLCIVFGLFLFFLSVTVIDRYVAPIPPFKMPESRTVREELEDEVSRDAIYGVLKERDARAYELVVGLLYSLRYENGDEDAVMDRVNDILMKAFDDGLYRATDAALVRFVEYKLREMADLSAYHDGFCYGPFWDEGEGATRGGDISEETRAYFREVFVAVMAHSVGSGKLPSEELYDEAMVPVDEMMYARFGEEVRVFIQPDIYVRDAENRARYCVIMRGYYETILEQPPDRAGMIMRWLYRPWRDRH